MVRLVPHGLLATLPLLGGALLPRSGQEPGRGGGRPLIESDWTSLRVLDPERTWLEVRLGQDALEPYLKSLVTPSGIEALYRPWCVQVETADWPCFDGRAPSKGD